MEGRGNPTPSLSEVIALHGDGGGGRRGRPTITTLVSKIDPPASRRKEGRKSLKGSGTHQFCMRTPLATGKTARTPV